MKLLKDLMSRNVKTIGPEMTIKDAARQMKDGGFGLMPVGDADRLIGTISDRDIAVRAVAHGLGVETTVREIMSTNVVSAHETDSVDDAAKIMSKHQVRRLPVLDQNKRLVGIVALGDLAVSETESKPAEQALSEISKPA